MVDLHAAGFGESESDVVPVMLGGVRFRVLGWGGFAYGELDSGLVGACKGEDVRLRALEDAFEDCEVGYHATCVEVLEALAEN